MFLSSLSDRRSVKMEVVTTLGKVSQGEAFVVDALLLVLADYNTSLRDNTFVVLAQISDKQSHIIKQLLTVLSNSDLTRLATDEHKKRLFGNYASRTANLLGSTNNNQSYSLDALFTALADPNSYVGREAANALAKLGKRTACNY